MDERFLSKRDANVMDGACMIWRVAVARGARYFFGPRGVLLPLDDRSHRIKLGAVASVLHWLGYLKPGEPLTVSKLRSYKRAVWRLRTGIVRYATYVP